MQKQSPAGDLQCAVMKKTLRQPQSMYLVIVHLLS